MFTVIYGDTPPHGVDHVITSTPCSAISPQRSLCPQNDGSAVDDSSAVDDDNDDDDISSQWSISTGPPSPRSITSLQRSLSPLHDSNTSSSVDGGCDGGDDTSLQSSMSPKPASPKSVATATQRSSHLAPSNARDGTSSHGSMSSDLSSRKSNDLAAHGPSCPDPSPYDSNADGCGDNDGYGGGGDTLSQWSMSSDLTPRKSDDIVGPMCPAPSPYDSNADDCDDDVDDCSSVGRGGGDTSPQLTISSDHASRKSDDIVTQGSIYPATTPYDSSTADDNTDGDTSSQWSMSPSLPSNATSQHVYDLTITAYNDVHYVALSQPSPTG